MISKQQVDTAIAAAKEAIKPDSDLSWVTRSAQMERAYFAGLFAGLRSIANENDLIGHVLETISGTFFARNGDDSFPSTPLGKIFIALEKDIFDADKQIANPKTVDSLGVGIEELDHRWNYALRESKELTAALQKAIQVSSKASTESPSTKREQHEYRHRCYQIRERLEECIRFLSLLQTDHRKWRSFDE